MSVALFLIRRVLQAVPLLFGLVTLVFVVSRLLPGDPTSVFLSPMVPSPVAERLREQFGLNESIASQYLSWLGSVARGDLGYSFTHHTQVTEVLASVVPNTLMLGVAALIIEIILAIAVAAAAATHEGTWLDHFLSHAALVTYALPSFWVGIMLISIFSYSLGFLPSSGMSPDGGGVSLSHLMLPAFTVAIPGAAGLGRVLRTSIGKTLHLEFIVSARSMGLTERTMIRSYILPNALGPMVSLLGIEVGMLLAGAVVTETLFAWPGMGRITVMAIFARDYPLILGTTIVAGVVVIAGNVLADVVHALLDPRTRIAA